MIVFIIADLDILKVNCVILASNILAIKILVICDNTIPIPSPTPKEISPTINVSIRSIIDIFLLLIPRVI